MVFVQDLYFTPGLSFRERAKGKLGKGMKKDIYKENIALMLKNINNEKFLNQIRIILKNHIEKKGETA